MKMGRNNARGPVSSISFERRHRSDFESDVMSAVGSGAPATGGSVLMVRGSSTRQGSAGETDCFSEDNKYLPLGIHEINEDDKKDSSLDSETYWDPGQKKGGKTTKRPYKREAIDKAMASALKKGMERRDVVLSSLKLMGVTAFIIDSQHAASIPAIMEHVQRVVSFVSKENRTFAPTTFQRCLLYQDQDGLLYNLVLPPYSAGLASKWQEYVDSFSAFQATVAFTTLLRSLPCAQDGKCSSYDDCPLMNRS